MIRQTGRRRKIKCDTTERSPGQRHGLPRFLPFFFFWGDSFFLFGLFFYLTFFFFVALAVMPKGHIVQIHWFGKLPFYRTRVRTRHHLNNYEPLPLFVDTGSSSGQDMRTYLNGHETYYIYVALRICTCLYVDVFVVLCDVLINFCPQP